MSGLNTLLQTLIGSRLPTVMGPSFAYILSVLSIINDFADEDFSSEHQVYMHDSCACVCIYIYTIRDSNLFLLV